MSANAPRIVKAESSERDEFQRRRGNLTKDINDAVAVLGRLEQKIVDMKSSLIAMQALVSRNEHVKV